MDNNLFNKFRQLIYETSGINLSDQKKALVVGRLSKRIHTLGINDFKDYYEYVINDKSGQEIIKLIDFISTNVTHFFRENDHFDFLKEKLIEWKEEGQTKFRIWSSACSTGEEPYSIAITAMEALNSSFVDLKILATDISTRVLEQCRKGEYYAHKVDNIPGYLLQKYFEKRKVNNDWVYVVSDRIKKLITFSRLNLIETPYPMKGPFDVIFCRNVMIYFDDKVRNILVNEIYRLLKPKGYLLVGHSESITSTQTGFRIVKPSVYYKP